ncbi:MAG: Gfo/Idh/MocA family oxidoreductase [Armatimonadetes bacterium]|nr:Gfo/Idh/MocA family oxidoreductase [Armatimonadota bacterium]
MKATNKVRVGVVGLGMGRWHLQNYAQSSNTQVVALCDIDKERLEAAKQEYGVERVFTDFRKLVAMDELDAITVATPNCLHAPITIAALKAGKHVLVEKPMAMSAAEAETMVKEAKSAKRNLMMHFNYRFTPEHFWLKRQIESGEMGEIYFGKAFYKRRRGIPALGSWFTQKKMAGGGALYDIGVHILDLALWLMDYPKVKQVRGVSYSKFGPEMAKQAGKKFDVDDLSSGFIEFQDGAALFLEASWASNVITDEVYTELYGTKGGLTTQGGTKFFHEANGAQLDSTPSRLAPVENPQQHFVDCILEGKPPICPGEHGLAVQRILDAIYASAKK